MKKLSLLLILALLLSLAACRGKTVPETTAATTEPTQTTAAPTETTAAETTVPETTAAETVTLYIPETMSLCDANGTVMAAITYIFEEGWQEKETFAVTYGGDDATAQALAAVTSVTYSDKCVIMDMQGISYTETYYDKDGRAVKQILMPANNPDVEKTETSFTYDEHDRILTQETKTYAPGAEEPQTETQTYTYTDTDTGSKGTSTDGGIIMEIEYDKDYRSVKVTTIVNGQEITRTENTYDAFGNLTSAKTYANGQLTMITNYTFTAVEVGVETAARLPMLDKTN